MSGSSSDDDFVDADVGVEVKSSIREGADGKTHITLARESDEAQAVLTKLMERKEWSRAIVFDDAGIVASTFEPQYDRLASYRQLFEDEERAFTVGCFVDDLKFDVHRYFPRLVYGRRGYDVASSGFALQSQETGSDRTVYTLITFDFPNTSAKCVSLLNDFCEDVVKAVME